MSATARIRSRVAALALAAALALGAFAPTMAFGAATGFSGGADQWPEYVANDHTPFAVHIATDAVSGLATSTAYYVKVRFTVGTTPAGMLNRGYTWNPITGLWAQERDSWTTFPRITTDASGHIPAEAGWVFAKFGDDAQSGPRHIMISMSATGVGATYNSSLVPTVTVLDQRTHGGWAHNGIDAGSVVATSVLVSDPTSGTLYSIVKTEPQ
ncbi:MAG: hypothetical protein HGB10_09895, partial [Coriobacteriia bacterium]|nr:hypothetical protein [Coriobacteriia bacterium]